MELSTDKGTLLIMDCGTGVRLLGDHLIQSLPSPIHGHIFLTHTHWDHIQGFPFFAPAFVEGNEWRVYGPADGNRGLEDALAGQMQYRYFPVELDRIGASFSWWDLTEGEFQLDDVHVRCQYLNHPAVALGYRIEVGGVSVAYCTDHEPFSPILFAENAVPSMESILHEGDRRHAEFIAAADLVIHDAQYTAQEYEEKRNWGHSTVEYVVQIAAVAGVKRLALFHHDPKHDDALLDGLQERVCRMAATLHSEIEVFVAREGQQIDLTETTETVSDAEWLPPLATSEVRPRVLVVEPELETRQQLLDALREEDYVLDTASDGEEALAKIEEECPDLVLMAAHLPSIDGFEVLERLRCIEAASGCPVIMLTGAPDADPTQRTFQVGADDYLPEPFGPFQLRARVTEWLTRSSSGASPSR